MNDFLGLVWSIRGIARPLALFSIGVLFVFGGTILENGRVELFEIVRISQEQLGYGFVIIATIDLVFVTTNFFNNDFSAEFTGIYKASFGYDVGGLKNSIKKLGHPDRWGEGKNIVCPISADELAWEQANREEMSEVDKRIDPETTLYSEFAELKTDLSIYIQAIRANPAKQIYSFSGFGIVSDEQLVKKGNHRSYVNLLEVDPRSSENKLVLNNAFELVKFIILGRKLVLRVDQRVTAHNNTEHPVIPLFLHIHLRYRPWVGLFVDGAGVIYLNLLDKSRYVANTYTIDGGLV